MKKAVIGMTMGDPGGIGPEIIAKSLQKIPAKQQSSLAIYGTPQAFEFLKKKTRLALSAGIRFVDVTQEAQQLLRVKTGNRRANLRVHSGKPHLENAVQAYAAIDRAAKDAAAQKIQAMITAPLNKTAMKLFDADFRGHTEFLAEASRTKRYAMMFVGPRLKVTLATIHVALNKVSALITRARVLEKIELTHAFCRDHLHLKNPSIAVCALNPHGRETGTEEDLEILPAVRAAVRKGICAAGPFSADQLFYDAYHGRFDAVISMYHDQALGPFKMISFQDGVNVTIGLPYLRTSPDHGTAFDIAYQGKADPSSFQAALHLAQRLL